MGEAARFPGPSEFIVRARFGNWADIVSLLDPTARRTFVRGHDFAGTRGSNQRHRSTRIAGWLARYACLILYALASISVGFAHRAYVNAVPAELAQFVLPDGTLPIICGGAKDPRGGDPGHEPACDACCLTSAPGLIAPPDVELASAKAAKPIVFNRPKMTLQSYRAGAALGARGPPAEGSFT